jgi:hypothetical protein
VAFDTSPALRFDLSAGGGVAPSYEGEKGLLLAPSLDSELGTEISWGYAIPLRAELGLFSVGQSAVNQNLASYRPFWGLKAILETGVRFPVGSKGAELGLLIGAAFSAAEATGTSLVSAYLSAIAEARVLVPFELKGVKGSRFIAGLPVEYMRRGATTTYSAGLEIGLCLPLGLAGGGKE